MLIGRQDSGECGKFIIVRILPRSARADSTRPTKCSTSAHVRGVPSSDQLRQFVFKIEESARCCARSAGLRRLEHGFDLGVCTGPAVSARLPWCNLSFLPPPEPLRPHAGCTPAKTSRDKLRQTNNLRDICIVRFTRLTTLTVVGCCLRRRLRRGPIRRFIRGQLSADYADYADYADSFWIVAGARLLSAPRRHASSKRNLGNLQMIAFA